MSDKKIGLGLVLMEVRPIFASTERRHRLGEIGRRLNENNKVGSPGQQRAHADFWRKSRKTQSSFPACFWEKQDIRHFSRPRSAAALTLVGDNPVQTNPKIPIPRSGLKQTGYRHWSG